MNQPTDKRRYTPEEEFARLQIQNKDLQQQARLTRALLSKGSNRTNVSTQEVGGLSNSNDTNNLRSKQPQLPDHTNPSSSQNATQIGGDEFNRIWGQKPNLPQSMGATSESSSRVGSNSSFLESDYHELSNRTSARATSNYTSNAENKNRAAAAENNYGVLNRANEDIYQEIDESLVARDLKAENNAIKEKQGFLTKALNGLKSLFGISAEKSPKESNAIINPALSQDKASEESARRTSNIATSNVWAQKPELRAYEHLAAKTTKDSIDPISSLKEKSGEIKKRRGLLTTALDSLKSLLSIGKPQQESIGYSNPAYFENIPQPNENDLYSIPNKNPNSAVKKMTVEQLQEKNRESSK